MRNFKTLLVIMLALVVASCGSLKLPSPYHVTPSPLINKGGKVTFTINDTIPPKGFPTKEIVKLEPYLKYEGGSLALKPMMLKGQKAEGEGTVINYKEGAPLTYTDVFDYKPEMKVSELWVKVTSLKGGKETPISDVKIADGIVVTSSRVGKGENVAIAEHTYEKETIINTSAKLYFDYNKSNLNNGLKLNKDSKKEMDSLREFIGLNWKIKDVTIDAWASPEGELSLNQELSDDRGATAKKFIEKEIKRNSDNKEEYNVNVSAKGADYDGFMDALNASDIADKNKIANVIKSQVNKSEREQQIRNMTVIYKEIEDMLAVLRRAEISVNCYQPKKTDEEIARLSTSSPDSLTVKELLYSATMTEDVDTKLSIYEAAIAKNDKCWRAYNNAAAIYINKGDVDKASNYIEKANAIKAGQGSVENNMGILAAWNKDYDAAKKHYDAASSAGVDVTYNMGVLKMIDGDYAGAEAAFATKSCDYNLALAQLSEGKTSEATKTLDCAEKTGEVYYLLAVIGARTNNNTMAIDNLKNAIDAVPAYKSEAASDMEFLNLKSNTDFMALIK
ncbi:MAG: hypothetical protein KAG84_08210 [Bacteroidales bacterium]|nr:hypothetical protein [Bacteroidales bacterium]